MAPPWVTFDSVASLGGSCANGADPDIAGLGVRTRPSFQTRKVHVDNLGRLLLHHCEHYDHNSIHACHGSRSSFRQVPVHQRSVRHTDLVPISGRLKRPLQTSRARQVRSRAVPRYRMEEGLCMAAVLGSTHHWVWRPATHHRLCSAAQWLDQSTTSLTFIVFLNH
jgi:hypothetical protein